MTTLEITLLGIIWIGYGIIAIIQTEELYDEITSPRGNSYIIAFLYIVFSPLIFIAKALYGAFKKYN